MLQTDDTIKRLKLRFARARAQARFRGERWCIEFCDYCDLFMSDPRYLRAGTMSDSYNLCRKDTNQEWRLDNVHIITRREHHSNLMLEKNRAHRR